MKLSVLTIFLAVVVFAFAEESTYTVKYDNIDLDEILRSERLTKNYTDCLLDKKSCPPDGAELKKVLPDALKSDCSKCSEKQKVGSKKVIRHLYKNKPDIWKELEAKYDPEGLYVKKFEDELKNL